MYVVEMRDYPQGVPPGDRAGRSGGGGTVRLLEDRDGDGRADRSTLFAEGLSFPTSIAPWRGGVFVTAPPEILYLEDTDGDRRADVREAVFDGFTLGVTDSNVNGLRWALDNHIHGANGGNGGEVGAGDAARDSARISIRGLDFRFDPRRRRLETTYHTSGGFGLVFDEWGRSFSPYNVDHLQQRVVPARYLARARSLPPVRGTGNVSVHGGMARIFPISAPSTRPNHPEQAGYFSSAGGIGYLDFAGDGLPRGVVVCDVVGNLASREELRMEGPVYAAERAAEERDRELFASRDRAFRPIGVEMGPDGALYLIDMQRDTIEHPDYIPEATRRGLDLRAGSDRGRIYRVTPRRGLPPAGDALAGASPERLVAELASPSRWRRDTAQRLLVERGSAPLDALRALAGDASRPLGRVHALWTLHGLSAIDDTVVLDALRDPEPGVRENALQIAEARVESAERRAPSTLVEAIVAMADDPSLRVRFQVALTLGELDHPDRTAALVGILRRDAGHRYSRLAVASALGDGAVDALRAVLGDPATMPEAATVARELADLAGAGLDRDAAGELDALLRAALEGSAPAALGDAVLAGLASGLERAAHRPSATPAAARLLDGAMDGAPARALSAWRLRRATGLADGPAQSAALQRAAEQVRDRSLAPDERGDAAALLALGRWEESGPALVGALAGEPADLQARAVAALAAFDQPALGRHLVDSFRALGAPARREALRLLLRRPSFHDPLVAALEQGRLTVGELGLDLEQRRRLLRSEAPGVAARAAAWIDDHEYGNRAARVEEWLARLPAEGSSERGLAVFERLCAQCHVAGGVGHAVGPDLASLAHRGAEDLVSNILDPSMAIHPAYVAYTATLASGERETGLVEAESAAAVTLLQAGGARRVIPRREIVALESTASSLMPSGLEQGLAAQDLRDLVAFIQGR
jgi:putative membrane-bound dehydrogenase-like protein